MWNGLYFVQCSMKVLLVNGYGVTSCEIVLWCTLCQSWDNVQKSRSLQFAAQSDKPGQFPTKHAQPSQPSKKSFVISFFPGISKWLIHWFEVDSVLYKYSYENNEIHLFEKSENLNPCSTAVFRHFDQNITQNAWSNVGIPLQNKDFADNGQFS